MSKSKNPASVVADETKQPTAEQQKNIADLNEKSAASVQPEKHEPTLDELKTAKADAIKNAMAIDSDDTKTDVEKSKAWSLVTSAGNAINAFNAKLQKAELEAKMAETVKLAKQDIMQAFGIDEAKLDELSKSETLRASFNTVFGKPAIVAREGQTGKSLVGEKSASGKSAEILADLQAGMTYSLLLEKYPTAGDATKLNGTARTVISNGKWKKQSDGTYVQEG